MSRQPGALRGVGLDWKVECKVESPGARLVLQAQPGARRGRCHMNTIKSDRWPIRRQLVEPQVIWC